MSSNEVLFLLFSICQLFCLIIPVINKKKIPEEKAKYDIGDYLLIALSIIGFAFSFFIFLSTQDEEKSKAILESKYQIDLSKKLAERDSLHQLQDSLLTIYYGNKVDSSYTKSIMASNKALAMYNLILIDSMNRVSKNINFKAINQPQLTLEGLSSQGGPLYITFQKGQPVLNVKLKSINNTAYNLDIKMCILKITRDNRESVTWQYVSCEPFEKRSFLTHDIVTTSEVDIPKEWLKLDKAMVIFYGTFSTDSDNILRKIYFQGYNFNFVTGTLGYQLSGERIDLIIKKLQEEKLL